jgi:hypothetical protein
VVAPGSGGSLVLASIDEQPGIGSISASGNNIVINVPSGAPVGSYSGQYCLRSDVPGSRLVDFGRIDFSVVASGAGAALPEDEPLPAVASATLNATTANFDSVNASAAAGDHIVLADGTYGGKALNRTFPAGNRLVIRAANLLGPTSTSLNITGSGHIISG